ncbi:Protein of unknown function [Gryllus bimaculatus]|nr:Protein of unknown function [Gryllus bimaculatus]
MENGIENSVMVRGSSNIFYEVLIDTKIPAFMLPANLICISGKKQTKVFVLRNSLQRTFLMNKHELGKKGFIASHDYAFQTNYTIAYFESLKKMLQKIQQLSSCFTRKMSVYNNT